ncbi:hypothetical protein [Streptomyces sp. CA-179760]|uniref:hypothetical protein n=1 Tax=Streptomyces sp. CA-179760 TaxID=3240054 RepID=UPI003D92BD8C
MSAWDAGVASAAVNTMQQVGGALDTALLSTLSTGAVTGCPAGRNPEDPAGDRRTARFWKEAGPARAHEPK